MAWYSKFLPMSKKAAAPPEVIDGPDKLAAFLGGMQTGAGVAVSMRAAMQYSAMMSCARVIAEDIGKLPLHLYEQDGRMRERLTDDPLSTLLNVAPNEFMTAREFWETCGLHLALRGNFYAWKNVVRGTVRELLPLHPGSVVPKLRSDWSVVYQVTFPNGKVDILPQEAIFHVRILSMDGLNGLDPITYFAREVLGEAIAADRQAQGMFRQGAKLSGVLSTDGTLNDDAYARIREDWEQTYGGVDNAYKVAILEGGLNFKEISMTNEQAQFLEQRKFKRGEMAGLYRIAPHKIGDLEHATFSNIEHQSQEHVTDCLMPLATKIEARIRVSLVPKERRNRVFAKFNMNALLRGDMTARANYYTKQIQNGVYSPNDVRELEDENPRDGGDIYLTPSNMLIDGKVPAAPAKE
ncbi:phage portal protein [Bordetella avium]|uniref:phage portal protein n=1 Tax=Bordetella avium TaxID=521 RepID=UPI000E6A5AF9|nr:phage portal protein [Bordetella avium]AZY50097.1 phage portal protein [Bordetella avium]RIQ74567.1 phage portal protein [Bordetella avium]